MCRTGPAPPTPSGAPGRCCLTGVSSRSTPKPRARCTRRWTSRRCRTLSLARCSTRPRSERTWTTWPARSARTAAGCSTGQRGRPPPRPTGVASSPWTPCTSCAPTAAPEPRAEDLAVEEAIHDGAGVAGGAAVVLFEGLRRSVDPGGVVADGKAARRGTGGGSAAGGTRARGARVGGAAVGDGAGGEWLVAEQAGDGGELVVPGGEGIAGPA